MASATADAAWYGPDDPTMTNFLSSVDVDRVVPNGSYVAVCANDVPMTSSRSFRLLNTLFRQRAKRRPSLDSMYTGTSKSTTVIEVTDASSSFSPNASPPSVPPPETTESSDPPSTSSPSIPSYDTVLRSDAQRFVHAQFRLPRQMPPPLFRQPPQFLRALPASPPRNSAAPIVSCAASPSVRLTRWRVQSEFDNPGRRGSHDGNEASAPVQSIGSNVSHLLAPSDLPRIFPDWHIPPDYIFDESTAEESAKGCCGGLAFSHTTMIRCFIATISTIGLCCVLVGIVFGALTVSGSSRLTLCLLMIGVGIVLIVVSAIAWRLTALDRSSSSSPNCWNIFGCSHRHRHRHRRESTRALFAAPLRRIRAPPLPPPHVFGGELCWRLPPPSYDASTHETRLHQILSRYHPTPMSVVAAPTSGSPPPTYRSAATTERIPLSIVAVDQHRLPPGYPTSATDNTPRCSRALPDPATDESVDGGAVVPTTECVSHDDETSLLQQQSLENDVRRQRTGSHRSSSSSSSSRRRERLSSLSLAVENGCQQRAVIEVRASKAPSKHITVVDCSQPFPVAFEMPGVGDGQTTERSNVVGELSGSSPSSVKSKRLPSQSSIIDNVTPKRGYRLTNVSASDSTLLPLSGARVLIACDPATPAAIFSPRPSRRSRSFSQQRLDATESPLFVATSLRSSTLSLPSPSCYV